MTLGSKVGDLTRWVLEPLPPLDAGEASELMSIIAKSNANPYEDVDKYLWALGFSGGDIRELKKWYRDDATNNVSYAAKLAYDYIEFKMRQLHRFEEPIMHDWDTDKEIFMFTLEALSKAGKQATTEAIYGKRQNPYDFLESLKKK